MPFKIVRNDITKVKADVIVNTANPNPICASGTDLAIYEAAGKELLLEERRAIGKICRGDIAVTGAYNLDAKYIIHTVGPVWEDGTHNEFDILKSCYRKSLEKALELKCESIAFPLISTGVYGFPKDKALQIAVSVFSSFLLENDIQIILVVFDKKSFQLSGQIVGEIDSYIDANYIRQYRDREYPARFGRGRRYMEPLPEALQYEERLMRSESDADICMDEEDANSFTSHCFITGSKDGVATITATTTKASSSISVKVLPNIRNIVSTVTQSHLYVGQTESISVLVEPNNCFDSSYEWKSSDKSVAIVDKLDDGQTVIRATGIGNCTLTCIAKEGGCSTTCNVLVESTFKKRENAHGMLSLTAMLAVACIFCAALSPVLCVPVAIATVVCGVLAIARNKGDRFWAFILMAVAVLTALEVTGITNWL